MAKILLIDDAAFMRKTIRDILTEKGYTDIFEASDGVEGIREYLRLRPDLVIMDITMPNLNGLEALKKIREENKNANVIMCSAMGQESMVVDAVRLGAKDFIVKPFKPDRLLRAVASSIGEP